jgi:hypothetical protein
MCVMWTSVVRDGCGWFVNHGSRAPRRDIGARTLSALHGGSRTRFGFVARRCRESLASPIFWSALGRKIVRGPERGQTLAHLFLRRTSRTSERAGLKD